MRQAASGIENRSHPGIPQSRRDRGRALGALAVSTKTSWVDARSRAEGVTMVWVLIKIFSLRVMAMRTSFSLTKSGTLSAGAAGSAVGCVPGDADLGPASVGDFPSPRCSGLPEVAAVAALASAAAAGALDAEADGSPGDRRSKMALTAELATSAALGLGVPGEAAAMAIAAPRGMPRALRTFSTMLAIKRRSGMTAGLARACAAPAVAAAPVWGGGTVADMR